MSVAKSGSDDANCGFTNRDVLHQAICRLYAARHHGRRRGSQRAAERGRLRPGGLQRGHHGLGPGRHGRQSRRPRRQPLLLVGRLRQRRHVRRLQQLRIGRRPDRAGQVHLVDQARSARTATRPGRRWRSRGHRRRRPLQVDPPAWRRRPRSASPCATSATRAGTPPPTRTLSRAPARCAASGRSARSRFVADGRHHHVPRAARVLVPVSVTRSSTFFERVRLTVSGVPAGWTAAMTAPSVFGWTATSTYVRVTVPSTAKPGTTTCRSPARTGAGQVHLSDGRGRSDCRPQSRRPSRCWPRRAWSVVDGHDPSPSCDQLVGRHGSVGRQIVGYEVERSANGGAFGGTRVTSATATVRSRPAFGTSTASGPGRRTATGDWARGPLQHHRDACTVSPDRRSLPRHVGRYASTYATNGGITTSTTQAAGDALSFTGRTIAVGGRPARCAAATITSTASTRRRSTCARRRMTDASCTSALELGRHAHDRAGRAPPGRPTVRSTGSSSSSSDEADGVGFRGRR